MTEKRFENRLNKDDIKFNTQNPVWDNEKNDALNVFDMINLLNTQHETIEQLKKELFESRCEYIYDTADITDKLYIDEEIEEMRKNIFEKGVYGID